jgi:hypothetical protein
MLPFLPPKLVEEVARRVLTDEAAHWFSLLVWSTRLVVVGVVVEGVPALHELVGIIKRAWRRRKERADLNAVREIFPVSGTSIGGEPESHTPTWVKLLAFLGLVAVAVGVSGEWKYEVKFEAATDAIQTFDNNRLTKAQRQARDAATSAKQARIDAKTAKDESDKAKSSASNAVGLAGKAREDVASAREDTEKLRQENSVIQAQLEEEQGKTKVLERWATPWGIWYIEYGQGRSNIDGLKPFAGTQFIIEWSLKDDSIQLARNLVSLLNKAGWVQIPPVLRTPGIFPGVSLASYLSPTPGINEEDRLRDATAAISDLLHANDIDTGTGMVSRAPHDALPPHTVRILVGPKAAPPFLNPQMKQFDEAFKRKWEEAERKFNEERQKLIEEQRNKIKNQPPK